MSNIAYFKRESKKLFKDYKTQYSYIDPVSDDKWYGYVPKFFDMELIFEWYYYDHVITEENFCLMKAQHVIANMLSFDRWQDVLNASDDELELSRLIWENRDRVSPLGWRYVVMDFGNLSVKDQIHALKSALELDRESFDWTEDGDDPNFFLDERSKVDYKKLFHERENPKLSSKKPKLIQEEQISSLPLSKENRTEFLATANSVFESILLRIEPLNLELTRKIWYEEKYAEDFIDNGLLKEDMLPISKDYALSLIDAFLVHAVIGAATEADKMSKQIP